MKNKKTLNIFDRKKDTISISDFVTFYLNDGITINCQKLTHRDLKSFNNPYVVTVSYEFASTNRELILTNKIILVTDRYNNIAPYVNPDELRKLEKLEAIDEQIKILKKVRLDQLSKLISLWSKMQVLLYEKRQIELTIDLLDEINKSSKIDELGGKDYVKKYQRR